MVEGGNRLEETQGGANDQKLQVGRAGGLDYRHDGARGDVFPNDLHSHGLVEERLPGDLTLRQ